MEKAAMKDSKPSDCQAARGSAQARVERGFTLLETAIAFTVMMVVGLAATGLFLFANGYNSGAADRALSIAVAKQQMEQLRNVSFDDTLLTIPSGNTSTTTTTTVSNGGKNYTVATKVEYLSACTSCNAAKKITVTVTPQDKDPVWGGTSVVVSTIRADMTTGPYSK